MFYESVIKGKYISFRSATINDAVETLDLRANNEKAKWFRNKVVYDIEKQKQWISKQINMVDDFFFVVIDNNTNKIIGTMGISEIKDDRGHVGRILMTGNAIQSYEAYLLLFDFAFNTIHMTELYGETDVENNTAIRFSKMYGFMYDEKPTYDTDSDRYYFWGKIDKKIL